MKVKKNGKIVIINDALKDRYLIDLGYEEVVEKNGKKGKKENVDVSAQDNAD